MQVRAHVGKVVNADVEPTRHAAQHVAHDAIVLAQGPRTAGSAARENEVHRASRADGPLELAPAAPHVAAVLRSRELGLHLAIEKEKLPAPRRHRPKVIIVHRRGNVVPTKINGKRSKSKVALACAPHRSSRLFT